MTTFSGMSRRGGYQPPIQTGSRVGEFVRRKSRRAAGGALRLGWRHRRALWPTLTSPMLLVATGGLHLIEGGWHITGLFGAVSAATVGWCQYRQHRAQNPWSIPRTVAVWAATAGTAAWATVATEMAPWTMPMPGLWFLGTAAAQATWSWTTRERRHQDALDEHREMREQEAAERAARTVIGPDPRIVTWETYCAPIFKGAYLEGLAELPDDLGWEATAVIPIEAADIDNGTIVERRANIARAYGVEVSRVVVEPFTDHPDRARLLILSCDTLREKLLLEEPTLDVETGRAVIGRYADRAPVTWRFWMPNFGSLHGVVYGTTGAGKSGLIRLLCKEIRHSGRAILLLGDVENGNSVGDWAEGAHIFAGSVPRIRRMLRGTYRIMEERKRRRSKMKWRDEHGRIRRGKIDFTPAPEDPAVYVVIDEAPEALRDPECRALIAALVKRGRKYGIGVILFLQYPGLAEFGNDPLVRSMLSSGNVVILRTSDRYSKDMATPTKMPIDPARIPREWPDGETTAGLGYLAETSGRISMMRLGYQDDPYTSATTGEPAKWPQWMVDCFAEDDAGNLVYDWPRLLDEDDDEDDGLNFGGAAAGGVSSLPDHRKTRDAIIDLLRVNGPTLLGSIAEALGMSKPAVSNQMARLRKAGVARLALTGPNQTERPGTWELVPDAGEEPTEETA